MTALADPTDPRTAIAAALSAYLTEDQTTKLVDEVLGLKKRVNVKFQCDNCGHSRGGLVEIPDAKAVVGALTDLLAQGFGRPGEAKVEDAAIVFKRLTRLEDDNGSTEASGRPVRARDAVAKPRRKRAASGPGPGSAG